MSSSSHTRLANYAKNWLCVFYCLCVIFMQKKTSIPLLFHKRVEMLQSCQNKVSTSKLVVKYMDEHLRSRNNHVLDLVYEASLEGMTPTLQWHRLAISPPVFFTLKFFLIFRMQVISIWNRNNQFQSDTPHHVFDQRKEIFLNKLTGTRASEFFFFQYFF